LITSHGAKPGDILVLTKPLGTGIISTALKGGMIAEKDTVEAVRGMAQLNASASEAMSEVGVSACTDVTGFSLLGHLREMLITSAVSAAIDYQKVPLYPAVTEMTAMGMIPAGAYRNLEYIRPHLDWQGTLKLKEDALIIMADPQTSGGLLVALSPEKVDRYLALLNEKGTVGHPIGRINTDQAGMITFR
jgi:selenide, water dikinase